MLNKKMIIDVESNSVYECSYHIAIASKFKSLCFLDIPKFRETVINVIENSGLIVSDIKVRKNFFEFTINISPMVAVVSEVNRFKKIITSELLKKKAIDSKPIFSTSFLCATNHADYDLNLYSDSLKPSYRSKKGVLL